MHPNGPVRVPEAEMGRQEQIARARREQERAIRIQAFTRVLTAILWVVGAVVATNNAGLAGFLANSLVFLTFIAIAKSK